MWNSTAGTVRTPDEERITIVALRADPTAERSSAGSAWQNEPPTVPRLRTGGSAICRSASSRRPWLMKFFELRTPMALFSTVTSSDRVAYLSRTAVHAPATGFETDADSNAYQLPTFLGNHDRGRIGFFIATDGSFG